ARPLRPRRAPRAALGERRLRTRRRRLGRRDGGLRLVDDERRQLPDRRRHADRVPRADRLRARAGSRVRARRAARRDAPPPRRWPAGEGGALPESELSAVYALSGMRASSASPRATRTGSSSTRSSTSWKKPRTISRSAWARESPRAMR